MDIKRATDEKTNTGFTFSVKENNYGKIHCIMQTTILNTTMIYFLGNLVIIKGNYNVDVTHRLTTCTAIMGYHCT